MINFIWKILIKIIKKQPTKKALITLLNLDNELYKAISREAVKYEKGLHPKHRLMKYHDFFINNISQNEVIFDIGCGNGALTYDVAKKTNAKVIGIDLLKENIIIAKDKYQLSNIQFVFGDALNYSEISELSDLKIDAVILSNVLEHIEKRVDFLQGIKNNIKPKKILIRVPMFEREWMVPMKKELEVDYLLDQGHYIEYMQDELFDEIKSAGLKVQHYEIRWGEIYLVAV